ncbi:MAG: hypothetical protein AVDCRST_MAG18-2718 [uncultured Thermomicrobiales bacterium]|uniref:Helix-turn-helix domain-containing protein n=1 Tax=uncultured Thermomicrobiales bacterium TaxID=1645740 RepID=A0A6J4VHG1_9BACT|nr:MAG: hypothetical protein AVDCRST_MAG18-2718 [uncultured Thermomicrobiales bacterium]
MAETAPERPLLTVEEAAERLGTGKTLAWELVWDGVLLSVHLGRCVRVPLRALEDWTDQMATGGQR